MPEREFEWDETKAAENSARHSGVTFESAKGVFRDPRAIEFIDNRYDYGEERLVLIGMSQGEVLTVVYTEREDRARIISARRATRLEADEYFRQSD